jgi:hypothetical protein
MPARWSYVLLALLGPASGCGERPTAEVAPASLAARAERRAFPGAPPVIPHPPLSGACSSCHTAEGGRVVPAVGIAPANPHTQTPGLSDQARCKQCHVFRQTDAVFAQSEFAAETPAGRSGERAYSGAPPTIPHPHFMREDCRACHDGAAARPEIFCRHGQRVRCLQCHVHQQLAPPFDLTPRSARIHSGNAADDRQRPETLTACSASSRNTPLGKLPNQELVWRDGLR